MKHYADNNKKKSAPRHSAKPSGGRRYAQEPEHKPRYSARPERSVKKAEAEAPQPRRAASNASAYDNKDIYSGRKDSAAQMPKAEKKPRTQVPATPTAPVPPVKAGYAPAFLFFGFIVLMAVWFIVAPKATYSASEKRVLADFPTTNAETVFSGQFGKEFETYFADHFPARNLWVGANAYTNLVEGNNGAGGVYKCSNGYLINKPVPVKNQIVNNLDLLTDFKEDIGEVPMTAMFVPSTGYIAGDVLPAIHDKYNDDEYFQAIEKKLTEGGVQFVDLRESFKTAYKNGAQLYYKTDHHWTTEGAYTGYTELCKALKLDAAPRSTFEMERHGDFYGTTYSKSGFWFTQPDTVEVWKNPKNTEQNIKIEISDGKPPFKTQGSMFFYEHDKEDDKYPIFLDGNHAHTVITNSNAKGGTILVVKDSFSHCFAPFLAENYSKVILVDMRYYNQDVTQMVKVEKPERVLVLYGIDNFAEDTDIGHLWG